MSEKQIPKVCRNGSLIGITDLKFPLYMNNWEFLGYLVFFDPKTRMLKTFDKEGNIVNLSDVTGDCRTWITEKDENMKKEDDQYTLLDIEE
ncbi:hypothetical protein LCGC14_2114930 [marine sediment metagenome]|uniref:Uncharacterized protein n=1 Tax=marine sediment metagenome TaxID=412755 RepID=A0A0F9E603_9ZZZZ